MTDHIELAAYTDADLARVDPLAMNLLAAKSIPRLADLDISRYEQVADQWTEDVRRRLPRAERVFRQSPRDWKDDVARLLVGPSSFPAESEAVY